MLTQFKELLEKIPFPILLVVYLASLSWDYYGFLNDSESPLAAANIRLSTARVEIGNLRKRVREVQEFSRTLEVKRTEIRKLAGELEDTKTTLSDSLDTPSFMKAVVTEAQRSGISVIGLRPLDGARKEYYGQQEFTLQIHGVFAQVVGFLERISTMQRIVRIDDIKVKPISPASARYVMLESELTLKSYYYLGTRADEVAKAAASQGSAPGANPDAASAPSHTAAPASAPAAAPEAAPATVPSPAQDAP